MIDERKTMTERMARSAMLKYNTANTKYSYKSAIMLEALYKASCVLDEPEMFNYVREFLDYFVQEDGSVRTYKLEEYSMDQVRMGNIMLTYLAITGQNKYRKAVDMFYRQLQGQPRTPSGGFWHKKRYENQMWLDGLFMQGPFYASYSKAFGNLGKCLEDIVAQFELVYEKTYDPKTGLLRHAWDESCKMPWSDPVTGQSQEVWSRAMGWYVWAIADLLDDIPATAEYEGYRNRLLALCLKIAPVLVRYQDKESGVWYQVMDKGGQGKNYLETSSTSMFIYFFAKMHRLGFLDDSYLAAAKRAFDGMCE
ncbi:MAG: glycoside hydrolase family 88 protein, partial [Spirochaetales bacterium]|nr:glycoside hydrolase family 88 protein [Spirochaetales bacterium]